MTPGPALPCPHCKRELGPDSWIDPTAGVCSRCQTRFDFIGFPALTAAATKLTPQAAVLAADSVCFFHAENRAEAICDSCGRLLCPVCAIPFNGQRVCPTCLAASRKAGSAATVRHITAYDGVTFWVSLLPVLGLLFAGFDIRFALGFAVILSAPSAPVALGFAIAGWRKPRSLVRPRRTLLVIGGILAALQTLGWLILIVVALVRK